MKHETYGDLEVSEDYLEFEFTSIGPKGNIRKLVQFAPTEEAGIMNLAFGNKKEDGSIDDLARDDNKDRNKILATIVSVLLVYFKIYNDKWVFFAGSTPERTRLYRMAITLYWEELIVDFEIVGLQSNGENFLIVPFEKGIKYSGFLIKRKSVKFDL